VASLTAPRPPRSPFAVPLERGWINALTFCGPVDCCWAAPMPRLNGCQALAIETGHQLRDSIASVSPPLASVTSIPVKLNVCKSNLRADANPCLDYPLDSRYSHRSAARAPHALPTDFAAAPTKHR
jgi:hypothetical protein